MIKDNILQKNCKILTQTNLNSLADFLPNEHKSSKIDRSFDFRKEKSQNLNLKEILDHTDSDLEFKYENFEKIYIQENAIKSEKESLNLPKI